MRSDVDHASVRSSSDDPGSDPAFPAVGDQKRLILREGQRYGFLGIEIEQMSSQDPSDPAVCDRDRRPGQFGEPFRYPLGEKTITLAAGWNELPFVRFTGVHQLGLPLAEFVEREPFPFPEGDFAESIVEAVLRWVEAHRPACDLHRLPRPPERAGDEIVGVEIGDGGNHRFAVPPGLGATGIVKRNIALTLKAPLGVPSGFAMAKK